MGIQSPLDVKPKKSRKLIRRSNLSRIFHRISVKLFGSNAHVLDQLVPLKPMVSSYTQARKKAPTLVSLK